MVCYASGATTQYSYIQESTRGTTPAGNFNLLPFVSGSFALTREAIEDPTLYGDLMAREARQGNNQASGEISTKFRADAYDPFLAAVMRSTWDTTPSSSPDELKAGTGLTTFSIQDYDSTVDYARIFTGVTVNSASFSTSNEGDGALLDANFGFVGFGMSAPTQTERTVAAYTSTAPVDNYSGTLEIGNAGGSLTESVITTSLEFTIENGLTPTYHVGSRDANCFDSGMLTVSGSISVRYKDIAMYNRFLNETESAISFSVNDPTGGNEYTFLFPRVKFMDAAIPVEGPSSRIITMPFTALRDATEGTNLIIYRPETA